MGRGRGNKNKSKKGGSQPDVVTEAARIRIAKILEDFRASDAEVYTFEKGLSNQERAAIHEMSRKMGMISKSSGTGNKRCPAVFKNKKKPAKKKETINCLKFSEETQNVLRDLFTYYPPGNLDEDEDASRNSEEKAVKGHWKPDTSFCRPSTSKSEIAKKVESLASRMTESAQFRKIVEDRAKLPIASYKDVILSTLEANQVVLISGETGCGKTTQVPQYICDYMWAKGETCKVVCTQPRRISAISVAERISYERGESVGEDVGYKIRLESKGGKHSSIIFCTNGILLRLLISRNSSVSTAKHKKRYREDYLHEITHIIVDEIHERDRFSDFMLAIIRDLLPAYPHLRLVLMSATIDADRFSQYFNRCPIIKVPGFTYPVKVYFLEDVLSCLRSDKQQNLLVLDSSDQDTSLTEEYINDLDESINLALSNDEFEPLIELISSEQNPKIYNYQHSLTAVSPLMVFAGKGRVGDVCMLLSVGADCSLLDKEGKSALEWAQKENHAEVSEVIKNHMEKGTSKAAEEELLNKYLASINPENIDTVLIERLLKKICSDSAEGAILVFLPGWEDINQTREKLRASPYFSDTSKFLILSLHSMIPSVEQKKVFKHSPPGVRKIILSTNIAETAVTIDDIVYVVDSGRMKEKSYDPYNNVSTLQSSWISKASARQREGRAGRCQPGTCYHLYSRFRASSLPEYQVPEIKRMPVEELCLQVKLLDPGCKIMEFLDKTLDPPVPITVRNAIMVLQELGALTQDEKLTELGEKLGSLPVHPSTSKMLLFAILMNCLEPALTLACALDYREPFILPIAPDERKKAAIAKVELASLYGGFSDQLAVVAAFDCWKRAKERGQESQFCSRYFVSSNIMNMLSAMRKQLENELIKNCFVPADVSNCSLNAQDPGILRAVLMAGSYPMVGRLLPARKNVRVETAGGANVRLHPHSCSFNMSFSKSVDNPLVIYDEITRGDGGMYIKNSSLVGPYALLLLAMEMAVAPPCGDDEESDEDLDSSSVEDDIDVGTSSGQNGEDLMSSADNTVSVIVDRWLKFEATALDVAQIYCLRERLSAAILFKVKFPNRVLSPVLGASMYAIACILSYDGLPTWIYNQEPVSALSTKDATGTNFFQQGKRRAGYLAPCGFLKSLISGKREPPHSQNHRAVNQANTIPTSSRRLPSKAPHPGSSAPRTVPFKRRR